MKPSARNNSYTGAQQFWDRFVAYRTRWRADGTFRDRIVWVDELRRAHFCKRGPYTKNHPYIFPGTSTSWRNNSNYERLVYSVIRGPATEWTFRSSAGDRTVIEDAAPNYAHMLADIPGFWILDHVVKDVNQENRAITECLKKLADGKANLAVAVAEARRTANMLAGSAISLLTALRATRRGDIRGAANALGVGNSRTYGRHFSSNHLAIKYGWSPLMMDIYGSYELLRQQVAAGMFMTKTRTIRDSQAISAGTYTNYTSNQMREWGGINGGVLREHKCSITARLKDGLVRTMQQGGLTNPLLLGWEVVPFSFVVDWFLPVGNVLEAATATQGLEFVGGYTSVWGEQDVRAEKIPLDGWTGQPRTVHMGGMNVVRKALDSFPFPRPYVKSPFSTGNVITALALWNQLRGRRS